MLELRPVIPPPVPEPSLPGFCVTPVFELAPDAVEFCASASEDADNSSAAARTAFFISRPFVGVLQWQPVLRRSVPRRAEKLSNQPLPVNAALSCAKVPRCLSPNRRFYRSACEQ